MMLRTTLVLAALLTSSAAMAAPAWTGGADLPPNPLASDAPAAPPAPPGPARPPRR